MTNVTLIIASTERWSRRIDVVRARSFPQNQGWIRSSTEADCERRGLPRCEANHRLIAADAGRDMGTRRIGCPCVWGWVER